MSQFVLVASGISNENFEKAMEEKIRSGGKVMFVPQHTTQQGVTSVGMSSVKQTPNSLSSPDVLNMVRFEWNHDGEEFGAEIVWVLAGHRRHLEERREPAA